MCRVVGGAMTVLTNMRGFSAIVASLLLLISCAAAQSSGKATQQYSTFIGGATGSPSKIAIDSSNNVYAIGTVGDDLPAKSSAYHRYAPPMSGLDSNAIFISKVNNLGTTTILSTYFAGTGSSNPIGIAVDSAHNIYIAMNTNATDLPVVNGFQTAQSGQKIYVAKFNSSASTIEYSTYYGGDNGLNLASGFAIDSQGRMYVTGFTDSANLIVTPNAFQDSYVNGSGNQAHGFLARFDPRSAGSASLSYSSYIPGGGPNAIDVDAASNIYLTGTGQNDTSCQPHPGQGCLQRTPGTYNNVGNAPAIFVAKFDSTGSNLLWATFFGATNAEQWAPDIKVDSLGQPVLTGRVFNIQGRPDGFPITPGAFQSTAGTPVHGWAAKLSADASRLLWATYMGDSGWPTGLAINANDELLITGSVSKPYVFKTSSDAIYPEPSPDDNSSYVAKFNKSGGLEYSSYVAYSTMPPRVIYSYSVALNNKGDMFVAGSSLPQFPTTPGAYSAGPGSGSLLGYLMRIGQDGSVSCAAGSSTPNRSVVVCSPTPSGMTHQSVRFYARAHSTAGVQKTSLYIDGVLQTQSTGDLLDKVLSVSPGSHTVKFAGNDSSGTFSSSSTLYVDANESPLSQQSCSAAPDSVHICLPANNATVYNAFEFAGAASGSGTATINSMVLYLDGKRYLYSTGTFPLDVKLRLPAGQHHLMLNAWTNTGTPYTKTVVVNVKSHF